MENCIFTKLFGNVDNDNLVKFREFRINARVSNNSNVDYQSSISQQLTIVSGDATFTGDVTSITIDNLHWSSEKFVVNSSPADIVLSCANKYELLAISNNVTDMKSLCIVKGSNKLVSFGLKPTFEITIDEMVEKCIPNSIMYLDVLSTKISGNLSALVDKFKNGLRSLHWESSKIVADFGDLGKFKVMTSYESTPSTCRGDIVDFVANKRLAGVTEGSITAKWLGGDGRVKFNGNTITTQENNTVSWTASTITVNGNTISA